MRLGIFDSGEGGKNLVRHLKAREPHIDTVFLCDRARAPYGVKSREELRDIVTNNLETLRTAGADRVLIACCTACTVYGELDRAQMRMATPIITPTARAARGATESGRVAVIATRATVRSHAFARALGRCCVAEIEAQPLVHIIDRGACDEAADTDTVRLVELLLLPLRDCGADTLVLGCTHFSSLSGVIARAAERYGITHVIDSAREGAWAIPLARFMRDGIDYTMTTKNTQKGK